MKKLVSFFKYLGLAVGVIFLEQLPIAFLRKNQPFWQTFMLILAFLVVTLVTVLIAKRLGFLNHASQLLTEYFYGIFGHGSCENAWRHYFSFGAWYKGKYAESISY